MRNGQRAHSGFLIGLIAAAAWAVLAPLSGPARGQTTQPAATQAALAAETGPALPTAEVLQAHITRLQQATEPDAAVRAKAVDAYKQALSQLQVLRDWEAKGAAFEAAAKSAPAKLEATRKELAATTQPASTSAPAEESLEELQRRLATVTTGLAAAKRIQTELDGEPPRRADRRLAVPKLTAAGAERVAQIEKDLASLPKDTPPDLLAAQRTLLAVQRAAVQAEIESYPKELASYDAERDLLTARTDLAARRATQLTQLQKGLQAATDKKRRQEAARAAKEAELAAVRAARAHPALTPIGDESAAFAKERTGPQGLAVRIAQTTRRLEEVKAKLESLDQDFKGLQDKEKVVGQTATFGVLLRKQRADLPDVRQYRRRADTRQTEIARAQLRLIELRDRRGVLPDVETALQQVLAKVGDSVPAAQRERIPGAARELLQDRRKNLDALLNDYDTYFGKLVDLQVHVRSLLAKTDEVADYIGERVLWIRSGGVLGLRHVSEAGDAVGWLFQPSALTEAVRALGADAQANPLPAAFGALLFACLLVVRGRLTRRLVRAGGPAVAGGSSDVASLGASVVLTAMLAAMVPGFVWFVAWRLGAAVELIPSVRAAGPDATAVHPAKAVAEGLSTLAALLLTFGLLTETCRAQGLAAAQFGLSADRLARIRRSLTVFTLLIAAPVFLLSAMEAQPNEAWRNALGRLSLIAVLLATAWFAHRLLRPAGPVRGLVADPSAASWPYRLCRVWHILGEAAPVGLTVLAAAGYYYTALYLTGRLAVTFWLVAGVALLDAIGLRWILVTARKLAARRLRRRAGDGRGIPVRPDAEPPAEAPDETASPAQRLTRIREHARQLLRTATILILLLGAWGIWSDALPALGALRRVELWSYTDKSTVEATTPEGKTVEQTTDVVVPVTLASLGLAVLIGAMTAVASRHLPDLAEVTLFQRLRMDAGARYAMRAVLRYFLIAGGVIWVFHFIGVGWSSVQWLIAAVSVGLGFGLQEIFANFVSGLIILFERPIRIGDTVTVGETAGTVSRIRIRATTITDWDRKELIVPNKEFVTGRLVNWTLSDKVLRVILRVGIAYGSDTELAEKLLYEAADRHPQVLDDPQPRVLFAQFGDNALNFELRVYLSGIEHYLDVWHDLNMAIDRAFREADITIAFPQRDTHLDTLAPLEVRIVPPESQTSDPSGSTS